jgi:Zn-dependent peptidase ImmA (M78 family)
MCVAASPLPIVVFSAEAPSAQVFTLAHELGHVALRESAISGPPLSEEKGSYGARVESWCNQFAAAFLVPAAHLSTIWSRPRAPMDRIEDAHLSQLANSYAISAHAMLLRLLELRYVRPEYYWNVKRSEFLEAERAYKGGGRSDYYGSRYRAAQGDLYTSLVVEALNAGRITNHSAAEFMGIKNIRHLSDIRDRLGPE